MDLKICFDFFPRSSRIKPRREETITRGNSSRERSGLWEDESYEVAKV
jgi:hypothetical protein